MAVFVLSLSQYAVSDPSNIDRIMYFDADIRDAEYCDPSIKDGKFDYGSLVTNPAMTCPDAFSWNLFAQVIEDQFWVDWANERQNWPKDPWPLCSNTDSEDCCQPGSATNDKDHCPVYPAATYTGVINDVLKNSQNTQSLQMFFENNRELVKVGTARRKGQRTALNYSDSENLSVCTSAQVKSVLPDNPQSIGRILRQSNSEITVRNSTFHEYLFNNNLYNANGVLDVFRLNNSNQQANAPYHLANTSGSVSGTGKLSTIDLPPDAIMIKSNWVSDTLVKAMKSKYPDEIVGFGPGDSYIQMPLITVLEVDEGSSKCTLSDTHYLMAFHISSKDIPQWVWTTFEHKDNPGRCDFTGCNDSFGYSVEVDGKKSNYITPLQQNDGLASSSIVYKRDRQYPDGQQSEALTNLFNLYGIATATSQSSGLLPTKSDQAWANYRLKGSQVDFTDHQGRATHLGNSITEAGFMSRSSCVGCHARAGVALQLSLVDKAKLSYDITQHLSASVTLHKENANFLKLGVFEPALSEFGYEQSQEGIPNHSWFYGDDPNFSLQVLQTDFIWGFLNANPLSEVSVQLETK